MGKWRGDSEMEWGAKKMKNYVIELKNDLRLMSEPGRWLGYKHSPTWTENLRLNINHN